MPGTLERAPQTTSTTAPAAGQPVRVGLLSWALDVN